MKKNTNKNKPTLVAFLLDRSGSMEACKQETISGFNAYIKELKADKTMRFTLTQFDTQGIDILFDAVPLADVKELTAVTYQPRGGTPLYDAMGRTIRETEKKAGNKFKVLFVSLTDGQENASVEWNKERIQSLVKEREDKDHWTFAYIGVGFDGFAQANMLAAGTAARLKKLAQANSAPKRHRAAPRRAGARTGRKPVEGRAARFRANKMRPAGV